MRRTSVVDRSRCALHLRRHSPGRDGGGRIDAVSRRPCRPQTSTDASRLGAISDSVAVHGLTRARQAWRGGPFPDRRSCELQKRNGKGRGRNRRQVQVPQLLIVRNVGLLRVGRHARSLTPASAAKDIPCSRCASSIGDMTGRSIAVTLCPATVHFKADSVAVHRPPPARQGCAQDPPPQPRDARTQRMGKRLRKRSRLLRRRRFDHIARSNGPCGWSEDLRRAA